MNLGKQILDIRKEKGMSQEQFGNLFHVTRQTVSNWENEKSYPDLGTLIEISNLSGVSLDRLLKEDIKAALVIDKERKLGKLGKIAVCTFLILSLFILGGVSLFSHAFKPMPDEKRNLSETAVTMYLNLPNATPSRAIVRTYDKEEYDAFGGSKVKRIQDTLDGRIEGDIPALHLPEENRIRFVFQNNIYENVMPSNPPEILLKEYCEGGLILPSSDGEYSGEIKVTEDILALDSLGYYYDFSDYLDKKSEDIIHPCFVKITYVMDGQKYVSLSAFYITNMERT